MFTILSSESLSPIEISLTEVHVNTLHLLTLSDISNHCYNFGGPTELTQSYMIIFIISSYNESENNGYRLIVSFRGKYSILFLCFLLIIINFVAMW